MKKSIIMCFCLSSGSLAWGAHLPLSRESRVDFAQKRVSELEGQLKKKQNEITSLEADAAAGTRLRKLQRERATLLGELAVAQNSLKSIENLNK